MIEHPFNKPYISPDSLKSVKSCIDSSELIGGGQFTSQCAAKIRQIVDVDHSYMTGSCTQALEMACIVANLKAGDEVILPSYTFSSTANAVVLRGATPVFVDIDDYLSVDIHQIKNSITKNTKMIIPVHIAGACGDIKAVQQLCHEYGLYLLEDAAQALGSSFDGKPLGSFGDFSAFSFHSTKNIGCGEGGALCLRDESLSRRAEIVHEKGTDRSSFQRGEVSKYSWIDLGSSFTMSDFVASFLSAQLDDLEIVTDKRRTVWNQYDMQIDKRLTEKLGIMTPKVHASCVHNAHMYYLIMPSKGSRDDLIAYLKSNNIGSVSHYIPLHSSRAGIKYGSILQNEFQKTNIVANGIVRLPVNIDTNVNYISGKINQYLSSMS